MKSFKSRSAHLYLALLAIGLFAGCSGGAQGFGAPGSSASTASHFRPQTTVSTIVGIKNDWIATISGTGSAQCWSISPGLPSVGGFGQLSGPVRLTYTSPCTSTAFLPITYGPGGSSTGANCTFNVGYNGTNFVYNVTQGSVTACSVAPSASSRYDEILTYAQIGPNANRSKLR